MRHHLGLALVPLVLAGCGSVERPVSTAQNPHHYCQPRHNFGTPAFEDCIETTIAERCAAQGRPPESPGFDACATDFREAVFLTQQLEIRGYRLFTEAN